MVLFPDFTVRMKFPFTCAFAASGFVAPWVGIVVGLFSGIGGSLWIRAKKRINFDDSFDAWSIHGVGGFTGKLQFTSVYIF